MSEYFLGRPELTGPDRWVGVAYKSSYHPEVNPAFGMGLIQV